MGAKLSKIPSGPEDATNFYVGKDDFAHLVFNPALGGKLRYIFDRVKDQPVRQFVLAEKPLVKYVCTVTLIEDGSKFTPRLAFSIQDGTGKLKQERVTSGADTYDLKARVSLEECHENFWALIYFLKSLKDIEIPEHRFSVVSVEDSEIVSAIVREKGPESLKSIAKELFSRGGPLSRQEVNQLLKRKEKLVEFEQALTSHEGDENWWQDFFEQNKWIFGYGLNYQILRQEQAQPHYGGTSVDGSGGQKGDTLTSTSGDIRFTVLVEIKTPRTKLLHGESPIRSGAWSLSKPLTDALSQIEANVSTWELDGSRQPDNVDKFEPIRVFTVQPKGIVVIGRLSEVEEPRSKRGTFERFRKSIHGIDILTFDELRDRARFIVDQKD